MAGYIRQDVSNNIANGNVIDADDFDAEFDAIAGAFSATTGHTHDGSSAEGAPITVVGPAQDVIVSETSVIPKTGAAYDLGSSDNQWKDLYVDGTANIDNLVADAGTVAGAAITTTSNTQTLTNKTLTNPDIDGGTIDGTVIGGSTPAAVSGTTGTFSGNLAVDANTLFVDATSNSVGIGTNSPTEKLDVVGSIKVTGFTLNGTPVTATAAEINYNDITTLGVSQASKVVTADVNGVITFSDGVNEGFASVTSTSNAATINCRDGNVFSHTLTENTTFTFSNPPLTGTAYGMAIKLVQGSTARTVTWPASVDWAISTAPIISTGSGEVDMFVFITHDGGVTWYGFTAGQDLS